MLKNLLKKNNFYPKTNPKDLKVMYSLDSGMKIRKELFVYIILLILFVIFASLSKLATVITDYWWFSHLGFENLFMISLKSKLFLFLIAAGIFFIFAKINILIASHNSSKKAQIKKETKISFKLNFLITLILSFVIGLMFYNQWFTFLQYLNSSSFNVIEPIFFKDASFYVFILPALHNLWTYFMVMLLFTILLVITNYFISYIWNFIKFGNFRFSGPDKIPKYNFDLKSFLTTVRKKAIVHISVLVSFMFLLLSVSHYLSKFNVMYSEKGIVVGAGYADIVAYIPIMKTLSIIAIVLFVSVYIWLYRSSHNLIKKKTVIGFVAMVYLLTLFIAPIIVPSFIQSFIVTPNEINLESPYIQNNLNFTRYAYGLDEVEVKKFETNGTLDAEILNDQKSTIDNIRILDWRPLTQTYKQTQEIRLYYELSDVDLDRYYIDGKYTQVMISPRELAQSQITPNAQTWQNLHLVYTHGYGVVMSPVNNVTSQGLPNYFIKDIPPVYTVEEENIKIEKPQIYFGEEENNYIIVNSNVEEFDYPDQNSNTYINYDGKGGILLDTFFKKLMMALRFKDIKILLSGDITDESRIMYDRNILKRVNKLTPFFAFDSDPYIVISEGKLYWIIDAYTTTNKFPYSYKYNKLNYIRNPVKIVVDSYDGSVNYYIKDDTDALMKTYENIFPGIFKRFDDMPDGLKDHIRYPVDLFRVQSSIYTTYHMDDVTIFYNKEDAWDIPNEVYGTGRQVKVEPYYTIMKLPEEDTEEFILMTTYTPVKKNNMISWFAARNDYENYGKLILYQFPKKTLIFGPLQIEAKFDQDSEISEQLTLWSQQGSSVTRGNLLVIPIENSILYVEPLYIQAETGQLPELKRILVSDGDKVVMEKTLGEALKSLFGEYKEKPDEGILEDLNIITLIKNANSYYDSILKSMENKDWSAIGDNLKKLGDTIKRLEDKNGVDKRDNE